MQEYRLEIDSNNDDIIQKILYYIKENVDLQDRDKPPTDFILESTLELHGNHDFLYLPKNDITFVFRDDDMTVSYKKSRESANCNMAEVRFDMVILRSRKGIEHINEFLQCIGKIELKQKNDELTKYTWKDSYWRYDKLFKKRKIDTMYMPKKEKTHILRTINGFLHDEKTIAMYDSLDIPHKKIFLFYGIPGTGKTSFIRALSSHFKHNICLVKNSAELDDDAMEDMINNLPKQSFLIFEDIDCIFQKRESKDFKTNITFSGLLNVLDGIGNYKKLIIFITTNYINQMDEALKRRVDIFVKFTHIKRDEIIEMYNKFFPDSDEAKKFYGMIKHFQTTPNAIEKFFINCLQIQALPCDNIQYLEYYTDMTSEKTLPTMYM